MNDNTTVSKKGDPEDLSLTVQQALLEFVSYLDNPKWRDGFQEFEARMLLQQHSTNSNMIYEDTLIRLITEILNDYGIDSKDRDGIIIVNHALKALLSTISTREDRIAAQWVLWRYPTKFEFNPKYESAKNRCLEIVITICDVQFRQLARHLYSLKSSKDLERRVK